MSSRVSGWTRKNFPKMCSSSSGVGSARSIQTTSSAGTSAAVAGSRSSGCSWQVLAVPSQWRMEIMRQSGSKWR
jgi:hypothetical protein